MFPGPTFVGWERDLPFSCFNDLLPPCLTAATTSDSMYSVYAASYVRIYTYNNVRNYSSPVYCWHFLPAHNLCVLCIYSVISDTLAVMNPTPFHSDNYIFIPFCVFHIHAHTHTSQITVCYIHSFWYSMNSVYRREEFDLRT